MAILKQSEENADVLAQIIRQNSFAQPWQTLHERSQLFGTAENYKTGFPDSSPIAGNVAGIYMVLGSQPEEVAKYVTELYRGYLRFKMRVCSLKSLGFRFDLDFDSNTKHNELTKNPELLGAFTITRRVSGFKPKNDEIKLTIRLQPSTKWIGANDWVFTNILAFLIAKTLSAAEIKAGKHCPHL